VLGQRSSLLKRTVYETVADRVVNLVTYDNTFVLHKHGVYVICSIYGEKTIVKLQILIFSV